MATTLKNMNPTKKQLQKRRMSETVEREAALGRLAGKLSIVNVDWLAEIDGSSNVSTKLLSKWRGKRLAQALLARVLLKVADKDSRQIRKLERQCEARLVQDG